MALDKNVQITEEMYYDLEDALVENGYLLGGYIMPPRIIQTDVKCPVCFDEVELYLTGDSYQIKCPTKNCVNINVRGI